MRVLSLAELELVAGGSTTTDPGYNVPGYYPGGDPVVSQPADPGAGSAGDAGSGGSGRGAGSGLGSDPGDPGWCAHTPVDAVQVSWPQAVRTAFLSINSLILKYFSGFLIHFYAYVGRTPIGVRPCG